MLSQSTHFAHVRCTLYNFGAYLKGDMPHTKDATALTPTPHMYHTHFMHPLHNFRNGVEPLETHFEFLTPHTTHLQRRRRLLCSRSPAPSLAGVDDIYTDPQIHTRVGDEYGQVLRTATTSTAGNYSHPALLQPSTSVN